MKGERRHELQKNDLLVLVNRMIETTGDYHHKYLVSVRTVSEEGGIIEAEVFMES